MFDLGLEKGYHLASDSSNMTAVDIAIERAQPSSLSRLLAAGALPSPPCKGALSPLADACVRGDSDIARVLVDAGHALEFGGIDAHTPLSYACLNGAADCVSVLLSAGAAPTLNFSGNTLRPAAPYTQRYKEIVAFLNAALVRHEAQALDGCLLTPHTVRAPRL